MSSVESRGHRAERDIEDRCDLIERKIHVVAQDEDRPVIDRDAAEAALQLVPIDDGRHVVGGCRLVERSEADIREPSTMPTALRVARLHEQSVGPRLEAGRITQAGKVAPELDEGLLGRILGELGVVQDPLCHAEVTIPDGLHDAREGLFVPLLCSRHEVGIHALSSKVRRGSALSIGYDQRYRQNSPISSADYVGSAVSRPSGEDLRTDHTIRVDVLSRTNDPLNQVLRETWRFIETDRMGTVVRSEAEGLALRWTYRYEMHHLLELSGLDVVAEYSDFDGSPPAYGREQVWVARRPEGTGVGMAPGDGWPSRVR